MVSEGEQKILKLLDESQHENILDDTQLIMTLEASKQTSTEVNAKIKESTELEDQIDKTRMSYSAVSSRGSILFFVIKDLSKIDPMYEYSLQAIIRLFNQAITLVSSSGHAKESFEVHLAKLIDSITEVIY